MSKRQKLILPFATKNSDSKHPLYAIWRGMLRRCYDSKYSQYKDYGGRNIQVCLRWFDFSNFIQDMGHRPINYTLDRINNNGNYEPKNCRWADRTLQVINSRHKTLQQPGVSKHNLNKNKPWRARISVKNKSVQKFCKTKEEAIAAYQELISTYRKDYV